MKHSSLGGNSYVVIFVDDCTRFKVVKFVKKKSNTTATLLSLTADYITPQKLSIKCVRTDNGGEFEEDFQRELDRRSITHEYTPTYSACLPRWCTLIVCAWRFAPDRCVGGSLSRNDSLQQNGSLPQNRCAWKE